MYRNSLANVDMLTVVDLVKRSNLVRIQNEPAEQQITRLDQSSDKNRLKTKGIE